MISIARIFGAPLNVPAGSDAFRNSPLYEQAERLIEFGPVTSIEVSDGKRLMAFVNSTFDLVQGQVEMLSEIYDGEESANQLKLIGLGRELLPAKEETEDILGVIVNEISSNQDGIVLRSILEMPAP